jgi:ribosomal protein S4
MSPVELTTIGLAVATVISSILVPWVLRRRAARLAASDTNVVSWQSITAVLQEERDKLRSQLDAAAEQNRRKIAELDADYGSQLQAARTRLTALETEVARLRDRLREYNDPHIYPA